MIWKIYSIFGDVELCFGKFYPFCDATFPQLTCIIRTRLNHEEMRFLDFIRTLLPSPPSTLILSLLRRGGGTPYLQERESDGPISQTSLPEFSRTGSLPLQKNYNNTPPFPPSHITGFVTEEGRGNTLPAGEGV